MTRLHRLAAHPRRTLGALAVVLAAVGITVGSGANFTASAANPGNAFSTGTLVIAQLAEHGAPEPHRHEARRHRELDTSTSRTPARWPATSRSRPPTRPAPPRCSARCSSTVLDCGAWTTTAPGCTTGTTSVYSGTVSGLTNSSLGNYAGGIKHRYKFTATLPASTNDTFQGLTAGVDFAWSATQS